MLQSQIRTSLVETTPPTVEPISLEEAKLWLRVDHTEEDDLITELEKSARRSCEAFTRRSFINTTWTLKLDEFPSAECRTSLASISSARSDEITLPRSPLSSVTSITYTDTDGNTQTVSASNYTVDTGSEPGRVVPAFNAFWPLTRNVINAVSVLHVSGYGAAETSVPSGLKIAIRVLMADLYEERGSFVVGTVVS